MNSNLSQSTALTVVNQKINTLVVPSNPALLNNFIIYGCKALQAAQQILKNTPISVQEYQTLHDNAKAQGLIVLDAALSLVAQINAIVPVQGNRNPSINTKEQILKQNFNMTPKQAWRLSKLTDEDVRKEKEYAEENNEIPTVSHAMQYANARENALKREAKKAEIANARINAEKKILPDATYDVIWADLNTLQYTPNIQSKVSDNAIIFILCEKAEVATAIDALRDLGFEYADQAVIVKTKIQKGPRKCFQNYHKCLLVGIKGNYDSPFSYQAPSVIYETNMQGVDETIYCQGIIEQMYPDAAYLDLVSDTPLNNRWDVCNNSEEN